MPLTEKARHWKDESEQLYSDSEADYVTIAVTPETFEVLDYSKGIMGDAVGRYLSIWY